jgi:hypothetical protein
MQTPSDSGSSTWPLFGHKLPKTEIVYFCQMVIVLTIVIGGIVNLSLQHTDAETRQIWIVLLSSSLGYVLPNPSLGKKLKRQGTAENGQ